MADFEALVVHEVAAPRDGLDTRQTSLLGPHGAFWPKQSETGFCEPPESAELGGGPGSASDVGPGRLVLLFSVRWGHGVPGTVCGAPVWQGSGQDACHCGVARSRQGGATETLRVRGWSPGGVGNRVLGETM